MGSANTRGPSLGHRALNEAIKRGTQGTYTGGKGILVRNPFDDYEKSDRLVVPSTFWSNDLFTPTAMFPTGWKGMDGNGNPNCPNTGSNGYYALAACGKDPRTGDTGPWNYATTGYIISDALDKIFPDWKNVQSDSWGYGVFYPTDSNAVDQRCRYLDQYSGYDCPGGWIDGKTGSYSKVQGKKGAGGYAMGQGGGAGCHWDTYGNIDQTNANFNNRNLVKDRNCQCEYSFKQNWADWVEQWVSHGVNVKKDDGWFAGGTKKAPSHGLDQAACWVNNPRDMMNLQNALYWNRLLWSNQKAPQSSWDNKNIQSLRTYWGWNEVPLAMDAARNLQYRSAVVIKLPAAICPYSNGGVDTIACLPYGHQENLEGDLTLWVNAKILLPGWDNVAYRPGSYIVFAREWADIGPNYKYVNWQRWFYCENWVSPNRKFQIKYLPKDKTNPYGACYIDHYYSAVASTAQARQEVFV